MKKIIVFLVILILFETKVFADNGDIKTRFENRFLEEYSFDIDDTYKENYEKISEGEFTLSPKSIFENVLEELKNEFSATKSLVLSLLGIIVISCISNLFENSENSVSGVTNLLVVTLSTVSISKIIVIVCDIAKDAVFSVNSFATKLAPMLAVLLVSSGYTASEKAFYPVFSFCIWLMGMLINEVIIPLVLTGSVIGIVNTFSTTNKLEGLGDFAKTLPKWILTFMLTAFTCINAIYGFATPSIDSVGVKCAKFAIGNTIPLVGGFLSDSVETVMMTSSMIKNIVGTAGIVTLIGIASFPLIKILAISLALKLVSLLANIVSQNGIKNIVEEANYVCRLMSGVLITSLVIFILSIAIIINSTNILA